MHTKQPGHLDTHSALQAHAQSNMLLLQTALSEPPCHNSNVASAERGLQRLRSRRRSFSCVLINKGDGEVSTIFSQFICYFH